MYKIRYADANDARVLGEIHSSSWKIAYRGIVPDSILDHISADKKREVLWKGIIRRSGRKFYEKIGFRHDGSIKELALGKKLIELRYEKEIE